MTEAVVETLKQTFATADEISPAALASVYSDDVTFIDPLGRLEGLPALTHYLQKMYRGVTSCRFDYIDQIVSGNKASVKWDMKMRHARLAGGKEITLRGVSLVEFKDRIYYQEDVYDLGALFYENVPLLRGPVKWLKRRAHDVNVAK